MIGEGLGRHCPSGRNALDLALDYGHAALGDLFRTFFPQLTTRRERGDALEDPGREDSEVRCFWNEQSRDRFCRDWLRFLQGRSRF